MYNTKSFIKSLLEYVNRTLPAYYDEAPSKDIVFPYAVISGINVIDLAAGDLASFYIDIWADEKDVRATETLEAICDTLRDRLRNEVIADKGIFACHIGFDGQSSIADNEYDLTHRRLSMSARIFYN